MSLSDAEKNFLSDTDLGRMWKNLEFLCGIDRTSGTEGEYRAVQFVVDELKSYGIEANVYTFDAYLSYPGPAGLWVEGMGEVQAKTRSFSESTPEGGVEGEVVYVPGGSDMFTDTETVERLRAENLTGKIVLSEGGGRDNMLLARRLGAVGYIHMWPSDEDVIHEGIVTPVWGTPTPETTESTPKIPVISIKRKDGLAIRERLEKGPVRARIFCEVTTGWRKVMLPEAVIPGKTEQYVLIGGHIDSWYLGATDNATGNVVCLELARLFKKHQTILKRGVKIAWWPGHSTGRYAGSTWYCDRFWQDIHDNCITYINIDSPGVLGACDYSEVTAVAENEEFTSNVVKDITGQIPKPERPVRAGDQSFWGPGVSSMFMLLSNRPVGQRAAVGGSGMGWWWHTEQDTIDKVEPRILEQDLKIYALATLRLCTCDLLPFKVSALATEIKDEIAKIAVAAAGRFDLQAALRASENLTETVARFEKAVASGQFEPDDINSVVLDVVRILTPVRYSPVSPFEHGPATPTKPVPMLQPAVRLARIDPSSDEYGFLKTYLQRRQNAVVASLLNAKRIVERFMMRS